MKTNSICSVSLTTANSIVQMLVTEQAKKNKEEGKKMFYAKMECIVRTASFKYESQMSECIDVSVRGSPPPPTPLPHSTEPDTNTHLIS